MSVYADRQRELDRNELLALSVCLCADRQRELNRDELLTLSVCMCVRTDSASWTGTSY